MPRRHVLLAASLLLTACADKPSAPATSLPSPSGEPGEEPPLSSCPVGHIGGPDRQCMPVGIQGCAELFVGEDRLCHPSTTACSGGTIPRFDEGCVPVGIPRCADAFLGDDGLCHPAMSRCPEGTFAVPQEGCVPVDGPDGCGTEPWGNIAEMEGDLHVDPTFAGPDPDGSRERPFGSLEEALLRVDPGGRLVLAEGIYAENITVRTPLEIVGRCPSKVVLRGAGGAAGQPIVHVAGAAPVALRGLQIGGAGVGVRVSGGGSATLDRIDLHAATTFGLSVIGPLSRASVTHSWVHDTRPSGQVGGVGVSVEQRGTLELSACAITGNRMIGAQALNAETRLRLLGSLIEGTTATANGQAGWGALADGAELTIEQSALVRNQMAGVYARKPRGIAVLRDSLVEETSRDAGDFIYGMGAAVLSGGSLTVQSSAILRSTLAGVAAGGAGSQLEMTGTLVRDTQLSTQDRFGLGAGVYVSDGASARIDANAVVSNSAWGVFVERYPIESALPPSAVVQGNLIEDTLPNGQGAYGAGLGGEASQVLATANAIVGNRTWGLRMTLGGDLKAEGNLVENTLAEPRARDFGRGIEVAEGARATLASNAVLGSRDCGIFVYDADVGGTHASIDGSLVRDTSGSARNGAFGTAVAAIFGADITLSRSVLHKSHTAGLLVDGSTGRLDDVLLEEVTVGRFTLMDRSTFPEVGDGVLVVNHSNVDITRVEARACPRAALLYDNSAGNITATRGTQSRFGLVLQGTPLPSVGEECDFSGNSERDEIRDGDLAVPDTSLPVPP